MAPKKSDENSLTVIVLDVSPVTWGERDMQRSVSDKKRQAAGKRSTGPATFEELLAAVQAFASASISLERDSALLIVAVAAGEAAVVYPRKDRLEKYFANPETKMDASSIQEDLVFGVTNLMSKASSVASNPDAPTSASFGAMTAGFTTALCLINRFLVASNSGVSALQSESAWTRANAEDDGVIASIGAGGKKKSKKSAQAWSPRVLLIQASEDRAGDYNAMMNCSFASVKLQIVVDGCFIPCSSGSKSSPYLEQVCDLTGGVFLAPSGAAQANMALSEVLLSVFLAPRPSRSGLNLPALNKVDFRPRTFDTGKSVDMAHVCNQCLSIFETKPQGRCTTCNADIKSRMPQRPNAS